MPTVGQGQEEEGGKTVLRVAKTGAPTPCPSCGSASIVGFGKRTQSIADLPVDGKPVVLLVSTRRFRCKACGRSFYESVEGVSSNRRMTDRLAIWITTQAATRRKTEIAVESGLSEGTVRAVLRATGSNDCRELNA